MSDLRLVIIDRTGAVAAYETCNAGREQVRYRARTWIAIGYAIELWADARQVGFPELD